MDYFEKIDTLDAWDIVQKLMAKVRNGSVDSLKKSERHILMRCTWSDLDEVARQEIFNLHQFESDNLSSFPNGYKSFRSYNLLKSLTILHCQGIAQYLLDEMAQATAVNFYRSRNKWISNPTQAYTGPKNKGGSVVDPYWTREREQLLLKNYNEMPGKNKRGHLQIIVNSWVNEIVWPKEDHYWTSARDSLLIEKYDEIPGQGKNGHFDSVVEAWLKSSRFIEKPHGIPAESIIHDRLFYLVTWKRVSVKKIRDHLKYLIGKQQKQESEGAGDRLLKWLDLI